MRILILVLVVLVIEVNQSLLILRSTKVESGGYASSELSLTIWHLGRIRAENKRSPLWG